MRARARVATSGKKRRRGYQTAFERTGTDIRRSRISNRRAISAASVRQGGNYLQS